MLGLDDAVPVYVERKYKGDSGSFSWWLPVKMDEEQRVKQKIDVPDHDAWNKQMYRIRGVGSRNNFIRNPKQKG